MRYKLLLPQNESFAKAEEVDACKFTHLAPRKFTLHPMNRSRWKHTTVKWNHVFLSDIHVVLIAEIVAEVNKSIKPRCEEDTEFQEIHQQIFHLII